MTRTHAATQMHVNTDQQIHPAVGKGLGWSPTVEPEHIGVALTDGVITLSGTVGRRFEREAARVAVESLTGVVEVVNDIIVRAAAVPGDAEDRVRDASVRRAATDAERIEVVVDGRRVTLRGHVWSRKKMREAERAAYSARGVTDINNELVVLP